jgi:two-component system, NtrC family, response regulator HydG
VIHLHILPLRERAFDIPLLVEHFVDKLAEKNGVPPLNVLPETLAVLTAYAWPGTARELESVIERAVALATGPSLSPDDLPDRIRQDAQAVTLIANAKANRMTLQELEREYILEMLRVTGNNKSRAAEILGVDRRTLHRKLDDYRAQDPTLGV